MKFDLDVLLKDKFQENRAAFKALHVSFNWDFWKTSNSDVTFKCARLYAGLAYYLS